MPLRGGGFRTELIRGATGSLAVKLCSTLLGLLLVVILARSLGPDGYGSYVYVFSLVSLMAIPAQVGLPTLLVRETAKAQINAQWGLMRGLWRWSTNVVGVISILLAVMGFFLAGLFVERFSDMQYTTFTFGIMLVPLVALGNLRGAALRGLRHVVIGQLPEFVIRPGIFILMIIAVVIYLSPDPLSASHAMGLHVVAAAMSLSIATVMLWRTRPRELAAGPQPKHARRDWLTAACPLALVSGIQLVNQNADVIILGIFRSAEEVGVYKVVVTGASLVAFGLQAVAMAISPHFARLHAQRNMERLQHLVTLSARVILLFSLPFALMLVFFGNVLLGFVFGEEFVSGSTPLAILAVGQLVNAGMGLVGALLIMTGHERDAACSVAIAVIANVILNFILVPNFGMVGAALATASSLVVWNVVMWQAVHRRIGVESMAFRIFIKGKE